MSEGLIRITDIAFLVSRVLSWNYDRKKGIFEW